MFRVTIFAAIALIATNGVPFVQAGGGPTQQISCDDTSGQLKVGDYFKPATSQTSLELNNVAPNSRSPCPGFNSLANGGYLPRDGKNVNKDMIRTAFMNVFNIAEDWINAQFSRLPDVFSLDFLSTLDRHASFVRDDINLNPNAVEVNTTLAKDFLSRADADGKISLAAVAKARVDRDNQCKAINPVCNYTAPVEMTAFRQAALLLHIMGQIDFITAAHAESFLVQEKIPVDFVKSGVPITVAALNMTYTKLVEAAPK
ncbi:hypothetical protein CCR75_002705 [Bremia lactucae]|uniref:Heme haloperoxidase family profile domain-containing protein n=1 Tax=Bremia lactucae TaxID=4779 RepID=A0A976FQS0_BRELC|nr:hypothetical protein CCR75_002705 [Bremia lactucae]